MLRGLYSAASGMISASYREEVISNNFANLRTPGFKKEEATQTSFEAVLLGQLQKTSLSTAYWQYLGSMPLGSGIAEIATDFSQGPLRATSLSTDLAIEGEGFFVLQLPDGEIGYTRNGSFILDGEGNLVTSDGYFVLGETGPIKLETNNFKIDNQGNIIENETLIDRLLITTFNSNDFNRIREGVFQPQAGNIPLPQAELNFKIHQGYLEEPNIDLSLEIAKMVTNLRYFEANQRVVSTYDQILRVAANEIGKLA